MNSFVRTPGRLPWLPLIFGGCLFGSALLQHIVPIAMVDGWLRALPLPFGLIVLGAGLGIGVMAVRELRKHDTTLHLDGAPTALVTTGIYQRTRNPIYIGNAMALLGIAIVFHSTWLIALTPAALVAVHWRAVKWEERHLAIQFKKRWHDYARRTPRWL